MDLELDTHAKSNLKEDIELLSFYHKEILTIAKSWAMSNIVASKSKATDTWANLHLKIKAF